MRNAGMDQRKRNVKDQTHASSSSELGSTATLKMQPQPKHLNTYQDMDTHSS